MAHTVEAAPDGKISMLFMPDLKTALDIYEGRTDPAKAMQRPSAKASPAHAKRGVMLRNLQELQESGNRLPVKGP